MQIVCFTHAICLFYEKYIIAFTQKPEKRPRLGKRIVINLVLNGLRSLDDDFLYLFLTVFLE